MYEHCKIQLLDSERYLLYFGIFFLPWDIKLGKRVTKLNIKYNVEIVSLFTYLKNNN